MSFTFRFTSCRRWSMPRSTPRWTVTSARVFSSPPTAPSSGSRRAAASTNPGTEPIYLSALLNSDPDQLVKIFGTSRIRIRKFWASRIRIRNYLYGSSSGSESRSGSLIHCTDRDSSQIVTGSGTLIIRWVLSLYWQLFGHEKFRNRKVWSVPLDDRYGSGSTFSSGVFNKK